MIYFNAFWVGGMLCVLAQILIDKTSYTPAKILTGYVVVGVILGFLGVYEPLLRYAGAGAAVPLTGFGNLIAKGVKQAVDQDGLLGVLKGPLSAGAVGITTAVLAGFGAAVLSKRKPK